MPVIYNKKVEYAYTDPGVKAHTLSWAEYQALSEDDKMNGDLYFIPDKQPEGNPSRIWTKLGTDPLTTQADDVSGAVNELNSSLAINDITSQLTPNSSILSFNGHLRKIGNVVYLYAQITPNRAIAAFSALVGDFPVPLDGFDIVAAAPNTERICFYINQTGLLYNRQALTANTVYLLCGSYIVRQ